MYIGVKRRHEILTVTIKSRVKLNQTKILQ